MAEPKYTWKTNKKVFTKKMVKDKKRKVPEIIHFLAIPKPKAIFSKENLWKEIFKEIGKRKENHIWPGWKSLETFTV